MRCLKPHQQMNVILDPTDPLGESVQVFDDASEILVQSFFPRLVNQRGSMFGAEGDVIVKTGVS